MVKIKKKRKITSSFNSALQLQEISSEGLVHSTKYPRAIREEPGSTGLEDKDFINLGKNLKSSKVIFSKDFIWKKIQCLPNKLLHNFL